MNQEQLTKAVLESAELEYLFDDDQWLPAAAIHHQISSSHPPNTTIRLLRHPHNHSGIIHLDANDVEHRLRLKSSN